VDLLSDAKERRADADLFRLPGGELEAKYTTEVALAPEPDGFPGGSLRIMPAGKFDDEYGARLELLGLGDLYREGIGEPLIRSFKEILACSGQYDYVLVDSRTGISEEAGICTRDLADHVMVVTGLNHQNVEGTCRFLRDFRAATDGKGSFQIILSPLPQGEDDLLSERLTEARTAFESASGRPVPLELEIPYHPRLALTEAPHVLRNRRGSLVEAYRHIETAMLAALGQATTTLRSRIFTALIEGSPARAARDLRVLVRLDDGRQALRDLVGDIAAHSGRKEPGLAGPVFPPGPDTEEFLLCVAEDYPLTGADPAFLSLMQVGPGGRILQETFIPRLLKTTDASVGQTAATYAWLLFQNGEMEAVKSIAWRVAERPGTPVDERLLYAHVLDATGSPDLADECLRKTVEGFPESAAALGAYAVSLDTRRNDTDAAEPMYRRALDADPKHAHNLGNYANFLATRRNDPDAAEAMYRRALDADPKHADNLGNYAVFLATRRNDPDAAEAMYRRALVADPKHPNNLANYGQFLAGSGRLALSESTLSAAFENLAANSTAGIAEVSFAAWLVGCMSGGAAQIWERRFKSALQAGFQRPVWSFDRMFAEAERRLDPATLSYAKALASAFLDAGKVGALDAFERWQSLDPLPPASRQV